MPTIELLGHIANSKGIQPDASNIESIWQWPVPTSVYDVQVFIGISGYYNLFVPKYANKVAALIDLLKKSNKWQ